MSIESAFRTLLANDAAVAALVSARIYPRKLPQNPTLPALTYFRVSTLSEFSHDGPALEGPLFQVSVWSKSAEQAQQLALAVKRAANGFRGFVGGVEIGGTFLRNHFELYEDTTEIYHHPLDFRVWFADAA